MNFIDAVKSSLQKYATFSGRASRSEYWFFCLFCLVASITSDILDSALFGPKETGVFGLLLVLGFLVPSIAVSARRLHDIDKSGWWQLINLIPIVGWIICIVWAATPGTSGDNRFGPDPLTELPANA